MIWIQILLTITDSFDKSLNVSEDFKCWHSFNDFIEISDNSGQNAVRFYVFRIKEERELTTRETEKENVWERELTRKKVGVGTDTVGSGRIVANKLPKSEDNNE